MCTRKKNSAANINLKGIEPQYSCTQLFQKELTPSDVGKLNRLVIPKKHAVSYFPYVGGSADESGSVDVEAVFYDKLMRLWKFRYCYWKSSQSYVFTRGWNRFVKDKKLKAKDVIAFFTWGKSGGEGETFALIDVIYNNNAEEDSKGDTKQVLGNQLQLAGSEEGEDEDGNIGKDFNAQKGLRLFGVCIT